MSTVLEGCKITHVAEDVSVRSGGVSAVVIQLSNHLHNKKVSVDVISAKGDSLDFKNVDCSIYEPSKLGSIWYLGHGLKEKISQVLTSAISSKHLLHIHGVWSAPQYFAAKYAYKNGIPFVVSAHGMLDPWLWNKQGIKVYIKKKIYWHLFAYPVFRKARIIHAITPVEKKYLKKIFPDNRVEIVSNATSIHELKESDIQRQPEKRLLYLGRLEAKKGIDILLKAFSAAKIDEDWHLDIVGPSWSDAYVQKLKDIVVSHSLGGRVTFHGGVFGEDKNKLMLKAWALVAPSHSEAVGLVNLEAASNHLPSITTFATGLSDWAEGGGVLCDPLEGSVKEAIEDVCSWTVEENLQRGSKIRHHVKHKYSWSYVLPHWEALYISMLK